MATVKTYMSRQLISVNIDDSLAAILKCLKKHEVSHLLVFEDKILVGVISHVDVLHSIKSLAYSTTGETMTSVILQSEKARSIMSNNLITVSPEASIQQCSELIINNSIHCLPVVENGRAIGIVTTTDLLKAKYQKNELFV